MGRFSELGFPGKHGIPENSCFDDRQTTAEGCYEVVQLGSGGWGRVVRRRPECDGRRQTMLVARFLASETGHLAWAEL